MTFQTNYSTFLQVYFYSFFNLGGACILKVIDHLKKKFKTINDAEEAYNIDYINEMEKARNNSAVFEHEDINNYLIKLIQIQLEIHVCNNPSPILSKHCFNMKYS